MTRGGAAAEARADEGKRRRSLRIQYAVIVLLTVAIVLMLAQVFAQMHLNVTRTYDEDPSVLRNPLIGFAPDARNPKQCAEADLVFILLRWADWEPEQGVWNTEGLEEAFHLDRWRAEKKHAVLRFVCDVPGDEDHLDIPAWLYAETKDGTHYDTDLGMGYSPDYANARFQEAHASAVRHLADYCNRDHFVSYVELGSLGHWGEWHASDAEGDSLMPGEDVCAEYLRLYADSFVQARLLTRRNYRGAVEGGMGIYHDMIGHLSETTRWLTWLREGGTQRTSGIPLTLTPVERPGRFAPTGGEFTSSIPMEQILGKNLGQLLTSLDEFNPTFIGPKTPRLTDEDTLETRNAVLRRVGYRICVNAFTMQYDFARNALDVALTWQNRGGAGFFFDWPVRLYVFDADRNPVFWENLDLQLPSLNDGKEQTTHTGIPWSDAISHAFYIGVRITDYAEEESVTLAIETDTEPAYIDGVRILYRYQH